MSSPGTEKSLEPGDLVRTDARIVRLRLGYAVYAAVDQHLNDLFLSDKADGGQGFVEILKMISKKVLDDFELGRVQEPEKYLDRINDHMRVVIGELRSNPDNAPTIPVVEKMAAAIRVHPPGECKAGLDDMARVGWAWFREMINAWGGKLAKARLAEMVEAGPASLKIKKGNKEITYCRYWREHNHIHLLAGSGSTGLFAFYDLPFYFLHEYVSHAFALWDDEGKNRFSEVYLLRAAHAYVVDYLSTNDRVKRHLSGANFDALRAIYDPSSINHFRKAEDCFAEMYDILDTPFLTHLLEWAAVEPDSPEEREECSKVLSAFHALVREPSSTLRTFFNVGQNAPAFQTVHNRLIAAMRNRLQIFNQENRI